MKPKTMKLAGATVFALLAVSASADDVAQLPHAFEAGWEGAETCALVYETPEVRVAKCSFPPGVGHEKHYHNPHFGYVLQGGTMRITDASGEREVAIETGATFTVPERIVHQGLNVGDTTTSYLMIEPRPTPENLQ
jgi:quercetin dioxygenase-like cupin family protein